MKYVSPHSVTCHRIASRNTQHGFTLIELVVTLGLLAVVTGVLGMTIYQFYTVTAWGNAQMTVDADARNAGLWLMRDGNESKIFTGTVPCNTFTFDTGRGKLYAYALSGSTLNRQDSSTGQTIGAARHIAAAPTCEVQGRLVIITLQSSSGSISSSATFTMALRVE